MSVRHPIIAITGSSGAGTTSVMRTFEQIFRREGVKAAFVEGDSFHRYDREEMASRLVEATGVFLGLGAVDEGHLHAQLVALGRLERQALEVGMQAIDAA